MTRLLVVAYYFPPKGGAGTQRFAKFCKFLPEFGVAPVVLGAGAGEHNRNAPTDDPSLLGGMRADVERVDAAARPSASQWLRRKLRLHLDEDEWAAAAEVRALDMAQRHRVDAVVTTLSPWASYRVGLRLQRELGLPWIVDLRDPWALDGWRCYRSFVHARADLAHMRRALRTADWVIANVPEARREFIALGASPQRTVVIPNGFDAEDFADVSRARHDDGRCHVVHMGTFHPADSREGFTRDRPLLRRHRQIAPLGRTGFYLLHALAKLRDAAPEQFARLAVHLYGKADDTHLALADRLGVRSALTVHGYVPHRESIAALCRADAVFVPLHDVPPGERALVVPGKLYEALASERPVLAALPPGDGADLVRHLDAGLVAPPTDADAIAAALRRIVAEHATGTPMRGCDRARLLPFTRRALTGLLAEVVRAAVARAPAVDCVDPWQGLGIVAP